MTQVIRHDREKVYLGEDTQRTAQHLTATHATVAELTRNIEGCGHKLYIDNFFSFPELYNNLTKKKLNVVEQSG